MPALEENLDIFAAAERAVLSVSQLTGKVRRQLERDYPAVWVSGEISNLSRPSSGHLYWTLKDDRAQVRCAMFRQTNRGLDFAPEDGMHVVLQGKVSLYANRGDFQIIVERMEEAGEGALKRRFEALKRKLSAEGLFDAGAKRALPRVPKRIGVISSPSGAALRDILSALRRRFPTIDVLIYPTAVQGTGAAAEIARTLELADRRADCDVLILARGGGSLEDLWAFNEEIVARAIYAMNLPVVAGVGHEIDFTIADFVADVRAPTPTAAAELTVPDRHEWIARVTQLGRRLERGPQLILDRAKQNLLQLEARFNRCHPGRRVTELAQRVDNAELGLTRHLRQRLTGEQQRLAALQRALASNNPVLRLGQNQERLRTLERQLATAIGHRLSRVRQQLEGLKRQLHAVSPLATLDRGYAIASLDGAPLLSSADLEEGTDIDVRLARGELKTRITSVKRPD